jgi:bifunctional non-homologous end joining protein LigD
LKAPYPSGCLSPTSLAAPAYGPKRNAGPTQHAIIGGWTVIPKGFSGLLLGVYEGKKLIPIGRVGTGFPRKLLDWLVPQLKQLETDVSPFSAPIPRKSGRTIHYAKPELVASFEMTLVD